MTQDETTRLRHDLRTYVNHVLGYADMILEIVDEEGPSGMRPDLMAIREQSQELLQAIGRYLAPTSNGGADLGGLAHAVAPALADVVARVEALRMLAESAGRAGFFSDLGKIGHACHAFQAEIEAPGTGSQPERKAPSGVHAIPRGVPESGYRVLVVDDVHANRDLLRRWLVRQGHQVVMAANGREALDTIARERLDLVLLDVLMPEVDGFAVLGQVKERWRDLPVVMISSLDEISQVARCIELGAEDFLPKPFDPVLLRARVEACLEKKRLRDQELEYLRQVAKVTEAAASMHADTYTGDQLDEVAQRTDALGQLARMFQAMAKEVRAREQRLAQQVQQLKIEIDEVRKQRQVAEVTETEYFQHLQRKADDLRRRTGRT